MPSLGVDTALQSLSMVRTMERAADSGTSEPVHGADRGESCRLMLYYGSPSSMARTALLKACSSSGRWKIRGQEMETGPSGM